MKSSYCCLLCFMFVLFTAFAAADTDYVLSGNASFTNPNWTQPEYFYPTGATYEWITSESTAIRGATDSSVISGDEQNTEGYWDMQDNLGAVGGGQFAVWGSWNGNGSNSVVTARFDLKDSYIIKRADVMAKFNGVTNGVGEFEVWVGDDPNNLDLFGVWDLSYPGDGAEVVISVTGEPVAARYVEFFIKRVGNVLWAHQLLLSEMRIIGSPYESFEDCDSVVDGGLALKGDVNNDCYVDLLDFSSIASKWLESSDPVDGWPSVEAENSIFGVSGHMLHQNLMFNEFQTPYWRPDYTLPWVIDGNLKWVREPLYVTYRHTSHREELINRYLTMYDNANINVILCPTFIDPQNDPNFVGHIQWVTQLAQDHPSVKVIELDNEANLDSQWDDNATDYVNACSTAYSTIKQVLPNMPVVIGSFSSWGSCWNRSSLLSQCGWPSTPDYECIETKWMVNCLQQGILNYCDGISTHPYRNHSAAEGGIGWYDALDPDGFEREFQDWWNLIQSYNSQSKDLKCYFTEIGWSSYAESSGPNAIGSLEKQAGYLSRLMLILLNSRLEGIPIESVCWYDLKCDDVSINGDYEANFGLVENDAESARDSYYYYKSIAETFDDYSNLNLSSATVTFTTNPNYVKSYAWDKGSQIIIPFWRMEQLQAVDQDFNSAVTINGVSITASEVLLYDCSNNEPVSLSFTQTGNALSTSAEVLDRACWLIIK